MGEAPELTVWWGVRLSGRSSKDVVKGWLAEIPGFWRDGVGHRGVDGNRLLLGVDRDKAVPVAER